MLSSEGFLKKIVKILLVGFVFMIIAWLIFGAPLTPVRLVMVFLKTLTGTGG